MTSFLNATCTTLSSRYRKSVIVFLVLTYRVFIHQGIQHVGIGDSVIGNGHIPKYREHTTQYETEKEVDV